jgi:IS30 family transposase
VKCIDKTFFLGINFSPEQIAHKIETTHLSGYLHVYADMVAGGELKKSLRKPKPSRKRCLSADDRRGQIPSHRPISE